MQIIRAHVSEISPEDLACCLANGSAEDFAKFWFKFSESVDDRRLDQLAEQMAENIGANRKICFKKLLSLIVFHEERMSRHPSLDADKGKP